MAAKKEFLLRIDPALWNELQAWAADELRSVNGQIEYILRNAIARRRGGKDTVGDSAQEPSASPENSR
ncbi:MAG: Arc family DNA binding domain-containing protein [Candidatus Hydrogenedentes bacterium]|nr:Arc family DNA binding domain-containing protein [Candidatus Hydrogenedentota bacterium]